MAKPTPGPWYATLHESGSYRISQQPEGGTFWIAETFSGLIGNEEEANANLIAAAPDLLEALQNLLSMAFIWKERMPSGSTALRNFEALPEVEAARTAIARAEGKEAEHGA